MEFLCCRLLRCNLFSNVKPIFADPCAVNIRNASVLSNVRRKGFDGDERVKILSPNFDPVFQIHRHRSKSKWCTFKTPAPSNDWLPFEFIPLPKTDLLNESGDLVKKIEIDKSLPRPAFQDCEELKTASDYVKRQFSLKHGTYREIIQAKKNELLKKVQNHPMDFRSLQVKIALITVDIRALFEQYERYMETRHLRKRTKVELTEKIHKRNQYLQIMYMLDKERLDWITNLLQIRFEPLPVGGQIIRKTRNFQLRRLTNHYCAKMKDDKINAFREELKSQQAAFLKEKEETLAWIAKEEEAYGIQPSDYEKLNKL